MSPFLLVFLLALVTNADETCKDVGDIFECESGQTCREPKMMYEYAEEKANRKVIYYCDHLPMQVKTKADSSQWVEVKGADSASCKVSGSEVTAMVGDKEVPVDKIQCKVPKAIACALVANDVMGNEKCVPEEDCKKPIISKMVQCDQGYHLEVRIEENVWKHSKSEKLNCNGKSMSSYGVKNPDVRCRKTKTCDAKGTQYFLGSECDSESFCEAPKVDAHAFSCTNDGLLEVKIGKDWKATDKKTKPICKDDSTASKTGGWYSGILDSGDNFAEYSPLLRCRRKLCTTCKNPTEDGNGGLFTPSKGYDGCSKFECGDFTRMKIGDVDHDKTKLVCSKGSADGSAFWNNFRVQTARNVVCLKSCTAWTKLDMLCETGDTHCAQLVLNDDKPVTCPAGMHKYYKNDKGKWNKLSNRLECNKPDGLWKSGNIKLKAQQKAVCHHGCDIDKYYEDALCGDTNECHEPSLEESNCFNDHGLQMLSQGIWRDATKLYCHEHRLMFLMPSSTDPQLVTENVRCIKKKIDEISVLTVPCDDNIETCTKPQDCTNLSCNSNKGSALQLKISNQWKTFKSARCNSDQFVVTETKNGVDVERIEPNVAEIRCIQKKCSLCKNPCLTCSDGYTAPATGNDCAKFECGANSRTVFYKDDTQIYENYKPENVELTCKLVDGLKSTWIVEGNEQVALKVGCEKSCTKISHFDSICDPNDKHCAPITLNDETQIKCQHKNIYYKGSTGNALVRTTSLQCDPTSGKWKDGNTVLISDIKSAVCHYGIEKIEDYFDRLSCLTNDDECQMPEKIGANPCPPEFGLQVDFGTQTPSGWNDATEIFTDNNRFVIAVGQSTPFVHGYRCIRKKIDNFFKEQVCDTDTECKKPENCDKMTCPEFNVLQYTNGQNWIDLPAANELKCNSDKFHDKSNNEVVLTGVRCARKKCTLCVNPCSIKDQCFAQSHTGFTGPTKWDDCAKFSCGATSRTDLILDNGEKKPFENAALTCTSDGIHWTLTGVAQPTTFAECRMSCALKQPLQSKCAANGFDKHCEDQWTPDEDAPHTCSKSMFYVSKTTNDLVEISTLTCDKTTGSWKAMEKGGPKKLDVPLDTTEVNCHDGCEISKYYENAGCGTENDCEMPTKNGDDVVCSLGFGLQVDFGGQTNPPSEWRNAEVKCEKLKFVAYEKDQAGVASQTASPYFPHSLRCIRKRLSEFYKESPMCKPDEDCKMPQNCAALTCVEGEKKFSLQVKYAGSDWQIVTSATCDSDKFTIDSVQTQPEGVKCVRKKCAVCDDPCPNCPEDFGKKFEKSTKWDQCATFSCDAESTTVFNPMSSVDDEKQSHLKAKLECSEVRSDEVFWKVNGGPPVGTKSGIACEVSCVKKSVIKSDCAGFNVRTCKKIKLDDTIDIKKQCYYQLYAEVKEEGSKDLLPSESLSSMTCNKTDGTWVGVSEDGKTQMPIPAHSNVHCNEGNCVFDNIFPSCGNENQNRQDPVSECITTNPDPDKDYRYSCDQHPKDVRLWYREDERKPWIEAPLNETELFCEGGVIKTASGEQKPYDFQGNCRRRIVPEAAKQQPNYLREAMLAFVYMIGGAAFVGLICTITWFKAKKKIWLHTLVIEKIRSQRDKKKQARKRYKKFWGESYISIRRRRAILAAAQPKSAPPSSEPPRSTEPLSKSATPSSLNSPNEFSPKPERSKSSEPLPPSSSVQPTSEDAETKSIVEVTPKSSDV